MSEQLGWDYPTVRRPSELPPPARKRQLEWDFPAASVWEYRYWQKVQAFYFLYPRDIEIDGVPRRVYRMFATSEHEARLELQTMVWSGNYKYQVTTSHPFRLIGLREADGSYVKYSDFLLEGCGRPEKMPEWFPNRGDGARIADATELLFAREQGRLL